MFADDNVLFLGGKTIMSKLGKAGARRIKQSLIQAHKAKNKKKIFELINEIIMASKIKFYLHPILRVLKRIQDESLVDTRVAQAKVYKELDNTGHTTPLTRQLDQKIQQANKAFV